VLVTVGAGTLHAETVTVTGTFALSQVPILLLTEKEYVPSVSVLIPEAIGLPVPI
jgi:hypothetical protein